MAKKRVHEIAKEQGLTSKELIAKLEAAASQGDGQPPAPDAPPADSPEGGAQAPKQRPTRDSLAGERTPGAGSGRRRIVIDSQASRRQDGRGGPPPSQKPRRGRRRREVEAEVTGDRAAPAARALDVIRINSGSTVKETAESLGVPVPEVIKTFMSLGEMATLTQTLSDEAIQVLAEEFSKEIEIVHAAD